MDPKVKFELMNIICELEKDAKRKKVEALSQKDIACVFYRMGEEAAYCTIEKLFLDLF